MVRATIALIDIAIVLVLLFLVYRSYKNGFFIEFTRAIWAFLALILAVRFMSNGVQFIYSIVDIAPAFAITISFTAIFASVFFGLKYVTKKAIEKLKVSVTLGSIDRIVAIAFGLFKGVIVISLITVLLSFATFERPFRNDIKASLLFRHVQQVLPIIYSASREIYRSAYQPIDREINECISGQPDYRREEIQNVIDLYRSR